MDINLEYRKGVLFIRVDGNIVRKKINEFENDIIPIILNAGIKYITFNFENVNVIDNYGINSILNIYELLKKNSGRMSICNMNESVRLVVDNSELKNKYFNSLNELRSLELFKL